MKYQPTKRESGEYNKHKDIPGIHPSVVSPSLRCASLNNPFITAVRPTAECPLARFFLWPKDRRLLWKGIFYSLTFAPLRFAHNFFNVSACHRLWNKDSFLSNLCSRPKAERRSGTNIRNLKRPSAGEGKILSVTKKDSWTMKQKTQTVSSRVFLRYRNSNISFLGLGAKGCWSSKNLTIAHLRLAPNFLSSVGGWREYHSGTLPNTLCARMLFSSNRRRRLMSPRKLVVDNLATKSL